MSLRNTTDRSTVVATLRAALATSRVRAAVQTVTAGAQAYRRRAHGWLASSRSVTTLDRVFDGLTTTGQSSTMRSFAGRFSRWVRASYLYRWLTAEPDPNVVVIDLRKTYAVGPVIAFIDRLAAPLGRLYRDSMLQRLVKGAGGVAGTLADTRVGQALGRALAPPEPPDRAADSEPEQAKRSQPGDERDNPP